MDLDNEQTFLTVGSASALLHALKVLQLSYILNRNCSLSLALLQSEAAAASECQRAAALGEQNKQLHLSTLAAMPHVRKCT